MNFERKAFNQIVCTAALASLLYGCSDEVSMVGSNETVQSIVSEDAATTPVIPPPLPSPVQTVKPSPIPSVLPPVPVVTVLPSPVPSPVIPVATPLASPAIINPVTQTFNLTIAKTVEKPITNLYLILDNSPSTAPLHERLAPAVVALANKIAVEKLNVNLNLLSTTDIASVYAPAFNGVFNLEPASFRVSDMFFCSYCTGANANAFFANRIIDDGLRNDGSRINPRTVLDYTYNQLNPLPVFVEESINQGTSLFTGGTLSFRESMSAAQAEQLITSVIEPSIKSFGTSGARHEAVIGTLYRAALKIPKGSTERHAFAIVTNEDDQTPTNLLMGYRGKLKPTSNGLLQMSQTATWVNFKYCGYQTIDGIRQYRCGANAIPGAMKLTRCADPTGACLPLSVGIDEVKNCTAKFVSPTNDSEIAINKIHDAMVNTIKNNGGDWPQPDKYNGQPFSVDCKANLDISDERSLVEVDVSNVPADQLNNLCNQPSSRNPAKSYLEQYIADNNNLARDPACRQVPTKPRLVQDGPAERRCAKSPCPDTGKFGAPEIGTMALQELTSRVGAKGFTIALIANDGIRDCDQKLEALPDAKLLDALLLESVGGNVALRNKRRGHVCDTTYDPVLEGLRSFITSAPQLSYAFSGKPTDKIEVLVRDAQGNLVRTITDFKVENGQITFKAGTIEVGENIEIKVTRIAVAG